MTIVLNGTTGITNDGGYTGDGVVFADTTPANTLVTTTGGNVGIGTSSPGVRLQIQQDQAAYTYCDLVNVTNGGGVIFRQIVRNIANTGTTSVDYAKLIGSGLAINNNDTNSANFTSFGVGGTERARIDSSGNLLVGTTNPDPTFNRVNGLVINTFGAVFSRSTSAWDKGMPTTSGAQIVFYTDNGARVAAGSITSSGSSTAFNTSSDYRLKENVQPMVGALDRISALKPVTYKWLTDGRDGEGFIAHELAEVCPDAVHGEKDAVDADGNPVYQGIDTSFLTATLTAAIQELKAINDAQAETITALTARVAALEGTQP